MVRYLNWQDVGKYGVNSARMDAARHRCGAERSRIQSGLNVASDDSSARIMQGNYAQRNYASSL